MDCLKCILIHILIQNAAERQLINTDCRHSFSEGSKLRLRSVQSQDRVLALDNALTVEPVHCTPMARFPPLKEQVQRAEKKKEGIHVFPKPVLLFVAPSIPICQRRDSE